MSRKPIHFTEILVWRLRNRKVRIAAAACFLAVLLLVVNLIYPRTTRINVAADGTTAVYKTSQKTVEKALLENGIKLAELDLVVPERESPVSNEMQITVTRVDERQVSTVNEIPFAQESRTDNNLPAGTKKTVQSGQDGQEEVTVKERYEDGVMVSQETVKTEVIKSPVNQVTAVGTAKIASRGGDSFRYKSSLPMLATAYGPGPEDNGQWAGGPTADGIHYVERGVAAVDPDVIPLGTRLYVEGYGFAIAADTGGAIKGNRIDLAFDTRWEALEFGMQDVVVYILE